MTINLTEKQSEILDAEGHLLITGGPGSGKTTISILKAAQIVDRNLRTCQRLLFLSFARATVSRVVEAIHYEHKLSGEQRQKIEVETYHSFFWRIIKSHGYLIGLPRNIKLMSPSDEAIALSHIRNEMGADAKLDNKGIAEKRLRENRERQRLAKEEGRVCFELFASYAQAILCGSQRIRRIIANMFPVIILDEFQDTNSEQWHVVRALGKDCTIITLADPEQRIYDFQGADPERLNHFREVFSPTEIDLSNDNHRSAGTDIALFGNEILRGKFTQQNYLGISCVLYPPNKSQAFTKLLTNVYKARRRLMQSGKEDWSLAILVPTKKMTRLVADILRNPPVQMKPVQHSAILELEGAILGAELIAFLMQPSSGPQSFKQFIELLLNYFQGKGGAKPTKTDLDTANKFRSAYSNYTTRLAQGRPIQGNSILVKTIEVYERVRSQGLTGNPDNDWRTVRSILEKGSCNRLKELSLDTRNLRLLDRGTQLRQGLANDWRANSTYVNALEIVRNAFVQEHFIGRMKPETGVLVMNMHKAKGKQFDEVIIFEGWPAFSKGKIVANSDRIVRSNQSENNDEQARQNFRVSVTRGKSITTILTPENDPCILLQNFHP